MLNFFPGVYYEEMGNNITSLITTQSRLFMTLRKKPFENIVGKGENAVYQHFLHFPQCFLPFPEQILIVWSHLFCRLQILWIWTPVWNVFVW